ncbi:MAG TPA: hypothetical protein VI942_02925, partial [Thermoanaerobaculia bacterium]|nr:hypothetical protein [Thermoanaerobaculia bacterium]
GDLTASAGAGLLGYVPVGSRIVFAAHALPQYTWWKERTEDRHWGGRAGLAMFLHSNHLLVELEAKASDLTAIATPETDERARLDDETFEGRAELPLGSRFSLFARSGRTKTEADPEASTAAEFSDLDRRETWLEGGVRWYLGHDLSVWLGAGSDEAEFAASATDRSNEGSYELAELAWERPKFSVGLAGKRLRRTGTAGSEFGEFEDTTGSGRITWSPRERFSWGIYALRGVGYPVIAEGPFFVEERVGTSVSLGFGSRSAVSLFYESGEHDFRDGGPVEDLTSIGATLGIPLGRRFSLRMAGRQTDTDRGGDERSYTEWRASVSLGELLGRWF